ncbi:hypothetical protein MLD52_08510 [Puniceicoccaceae bacterium K14]|nr:hypothetical protein [Puniceicoccaceae bacterium K14]
MISETLKEIAGYEAKIASLQKKVESDRRKELASLHKKVGFDKRADLIACLMELENKKPSRVSYSKAGKTRAKRTRITDSLRADIIKAVKKGEKGVEVAARFGVSIPTLHNIKKAAGLVKARS